MRRVGNLYEDVADAENIMRAARQAIKGKGYASSATSLRFDLEPTVFQLARELQERTYVPGRYHSFIVYDKKKRSISVSPMRDRVVHHALCNVIEPIFEKAFIRDTYACRKDKGTHAAVAYAREAARRHPYFLKTDVKSYFFSIDRQRLREILARKIKDPDVLRLIGLIVDADDVAGAEKGRGVPIGNLTSQLFANVYLDRVDHHIKERLRVKDYLRYMDDLLCFGESAEELWGMLYEIAGFLGDELGLEINRKATIVAPVYCGIPFLGYRVFPGILRLSPDSKKRFMAKCRMRQRRYAAGRLREDALRESVGSLTAFAAKADTFRMRRDFFLGRQPRAVPTA